MALELEQVIQRYSFDISEFESGISRAQQRLRQFQQDASRLSTISLGAGAAGQGGIARQIDQATVALQRQARAASLASSQILAAQRAVSQFASGMAAAGASGASIGRVADQWSMTSRQILQAQRSVRQFEEAQTRAAQTPTSAARQWQVTERHISLAEQSVKRFEEAQRRAQGTGASTGRAVPIVGGMVATDPRREGGAAAQRAAEAANLEAAAHRGTAVARAQSQRSIESLVLSLGGEEAVALRVARAQDTLNAAVRRGVIDQARMNQLLAQATLRFRQSELGATSLAGKLRSLAPLAAGQAVATAVPGIGGFALGSAIGQRGGLAAAGAVGGAVAGGLALASTARAADQMRLLNAQLEAFLGNSSLASDAFEDLFATSQATGTSLADNAVLFRRLVQAQQDLGASLSDISQFQRTVTQLMVASGVSTTEAAAGTTQLAQALASGKVQGDEFRSVMENMTQVARAAAQGLFEMGVLTEPTIGALNRLREEGKLTASEFFEAVLTQSGRAQELFDKMPDTIGRSASRVGNEFTRLAAKIGESSGVVDVTTGLLNGLSNILGALSDADYSKISSGLASLIPPEMAERTEGAVSFLSRLANQITNLGNILDEGELENVRKRIGDVQAGLERAREFQAQLQAQGVEIPLAGIPEGREAAEQLDMIGQSLEVARVRAETFGQTLDEALKELRDVDTTQLEQELTELLPELGPELRRRVASELQQRLPEGKIEISPELRSEEVVKTVQEIQRVLQRNVAVPLHKELKIDLDLQQLSDFEQEVSRILEPFQEAGVAPTPDIAALASRVVAGVQFKDFRQSFRRQLEDIKTQDLPELERILADLQAPLIEFGLSIPPAELEKMRTQISEALEQSRLIRLRPEAATQLIEQQVQVATRAGRAPTRALAELPQIRDQMAEQISRAVGQPITIAADGTFLAEQPMTIELQAQIMAAVEGMEDAKSTLAAQFQALQEVANEEGERLQNAVQAALRIQAERGFKFLGDLQPERLLRREISDIGANLRFLQSEAAGPLQITPEEAGPLRVQAQAEARTNILPFGPRTKAVLEEQSTQGVHRELEAMLELLGTVEQAASQAGSMMAASFAEAALSGESLSEVLKSLAEDVAKLILQTAINVPIQAGIQAAFGGLGGAMVGAFGAGTPQIAGFNAGLVGGPAQINQAGAGAGFGTTGAGGAGFSLPFFGGPRQHGGPVSPGKAYVVGEAGPEVFRPDRSGTIIPFNPATQRMQAGGHVMARRSVLTGEVDPELFMAGGQSSRRSGGDIKVEPKTEIRIVNQGMTSQVSAEPRRGSGGSQIIDVMVTDSLSRLHQGGQLDGLRQQRGVRRS